MIKYHYGMENKDEGHNGFCFDCFVNEMAFCMSLRMA